MQKPQKVIGIDIGGTKISIGSVKDGEVTKLIKFDTLAEAPKEYIINEIIQNIEALEPDDFEGIGIGVPGLIDEKRGIVYNVQNIPAWKEVHLKETLEKHFKKPVYLSNDANCFVLGELVYGKGKSYSNIVGLSLGTGLGAGIAIHGNLYSGLFSGAGEFGCVSYLDKTFEDYCSGKFFKTHCGLTGAEVYEQALKGEKSALQAMDTFGGHLGKVIQLIMYTVSPEAIFLGGSINKAFSFFEGAMWKSIGTFPFKKVIETIVIEPSEIKNGPILGAAALFLSRSGSDIGNKDAVYA